MLPAFYAWPALRSPPSCIFLCLETRCDHVSAQTVCRGISHMHRHPVNLGLATIREFCMWRHPATWKVCVGTPDLASDRVPSPSHDANTCSRILGTLLFL